MKLTFDSIFNNKNYYYYLILYYDNKEYIDSERDIAKFLEIDYLTLIKIMNKYYAYREGGSYFFYKVEDVEGLINELEPYLIMKKLQ